MASRFVRPTNSADSTMSSHVAGRVFKTAGQQGWRAAPHALVSSCPPLPRPHLQPHPLPLTAPDSNPQKSPAGWGWWGDGQAVSGVNSRPLRPASWIDSSLWHRATGKESRVKVLMLETLVFRWCFASGCCFDVFALQFNVSVKVRSFFSISSRCLYRCLFFACLATVVISTHTSSSYLIWNVKWVFPNWFIKSGKCHRIHNDLNFTSV